jgi:RNA polymerase sigma-70 factor (ECF subfamily)
LDGESRQNQEAQEPQEQNWSDDELIRQSQQGDRRCLELLYLRHRFLVLRFAQRIVGDEDEAQDVLQETFKYVFQRLSTYKPQAKFTTFLYKVTHHTALKWVTRKRKRFRLLKDHCEPTLSEVSPELLPEEGLIHQEEVAHLQKQLETLLPLHREVLHLRIYEELSYEEIAEILNIPLGTVKSRLHHGISQLRQRIRREF